MIVQENEQGNKTQHFQKETVSFNLKLDLSPEKLYITLENLQDWIIYYKEYTEKDVGKEIHKKMEIKDVYLSLIQSANSNQETDKSINDKNNISFGEIFKKQDIPCYKIERDGKITVYAAMLDQRVNKQMIFQSHLQLEKLRSFTEKQIMDLKFVRHQVQRQLKIQQEIEALKNENEMLKIALADYSPHKISKEQEPILIEDEEQEESSMKPTIHKIEIIMKERKLENPKHPQKQIKRFPSGKKSNALDERQMTELIEQYVRIQKNNRRRHFITEKQLQIFMQYKGYQVSEKEIYPVFKRIKRKLSIAFIIPPNVLEEYEQTKDQALKREIRRKYHCTQIQMQKKLIYQKTKALKIKHQISQIYAANRKQNRDRSVKEEISISED